MADNTTTTAKEDNKSSLSEAEKFLESLNLPDAHSQTTDDNEITKPDPNDIMSFLDEISNYPTEDNNTALEENKIKDSVQSTSSPIKQQQQSSSSNNNEAGGWKAWGNSFWSQASAAVKNTTDQINRTVANSDSAAKLLESRVKTIQSLVNKENIEKLGTGLKNLTTTLLETVAPPISEHELVEVWLAYDMVGYVGLESLVYRAFARVMEYTESGQVVVRSPDNKQSDPTDPASLNLNMCDSVLDGTKLAKANMDHLIKQHMTPESEKKDETHYNPQLGAVPVIRCPVFMSIQPVKMAMTAMDDEDTDNDQLVFIILMVDPTNKIRFKTYSQSIPLNWLNIPYEENEWVEDKLTDVLRMAVTSIAQDYVWTRMSGTSNSSPRKNDEEKVEEI
ncbi:MAG: maintenance of telomere capping protein 1 [Benjaminiella poitrasii]|nr:MAG: maintenance of telomere capping protein 1 [Benjaminiella poitrasii]